MKAYARSQGKPTTWSEEDKGYVTEWYGYWYTDGLDDFNVPHVLRLGLLSVNVILSITVILFVVGFAPRYHVHLTRIVTEKRQVLNFYWAFVVVLFLLNLIAITYSITSHVKDLLELLQFHCYKSVVVFKDHIINSCINITIILICLVLYFLVALYTNSKNKIPCGCCPRISCICSRALQTFAMWNILISIQLFTLGAVSICLMMIYAPIRTFSVLAVVATIILSLILTIAHVLEVCSACSGKHGNVKDWKLKCIRFFAVLALFILITAALMIYITLLKGVGTKGAPGLILPLVPSVILSSVGWYARREFLRRTTNTYTPLEMDSEDNELEEGL